MEKRCSPTAPHSTTVEVVLVLDVVEVLEVVVVTTAGKVVVGRAPECTVVMPEDPYTSTRHARFFERDGAWWVEDLGSTNGTLVNAKTITEAQQLKRDDRVQTGSAVFEVQ